MTTGLPRPAAASRRARARASPGMGNGGTKTTTSASTSASARRGHDGRGGSAGLTVVPTSTCSPAASSPSPCSASTTSTFSAVELPTTATRPSAGQRLEGQQLGVSNIWVTFCTWIMPAALEEVETLLVDGDRRADAGRAESQPTALPARSATATAPWSGPAGGRAGRTCAGRRTISR